MSVPVQTGSDAGFRTEPEARLWVDRSSPVIDIVLVAIPFVALLINRWIGPLTPILIMSVTPIYMLLRWERLYSVFIKCWPLVLLPVFAIASVLWSEAPEQTLRYGTLYLLTVLSAVLIGAGSDRIAILKGIFCAFAIYMVLSLLFGRWVSWDGGGTAFAGLMGSKNASGDAAALSVLISVSFLLWARRGGRAVWTILALGILPMGLFSLWASKATGALIATLISLPCLLMWTASRRLTQRVRASIFLLGLLLLALLLATMSYWMPPLFEMVLESSGKDVGLTGRDFLWRKADELIVQNPIIGTGYNGFWVINNLDAEYLWRELGIASRSGFNFHNTPRDILVDLGIVGLTLFAVVVFYASFKLIFRTMRSPDYTGIFCCTLFVFESPRIFFELVAFQNMHFSTLIVFIMLAYGMRPATVPNFSRG